MLGLGGSAAGCARSANVHALFPVEYVLPAYRGYFKNVSGYRPDTPVCECAELTAPVCLFSLFRVCVSFCAIFCAILFVRSSGSCVEWLCGVGFSCEDWRKNVRRLLVRLSVETLCRRLCAWLSPEYGEG